LNYEIRIENAREGNGKIDLQRLVNIAQGIRRISEGALQIRLRGISLTSGRKKVSLEDALRVTLTGIKDGSVVLNLDRNLCQYFGCLSNGLVSLETNVLLAHYRAHPLYERITEQNNLHDRDVVLIMPVAVKAEILSIALQKNWGERKYNLVKKNYSCKL
jgi:hypothetical protein